MDLAKVASRDANVKTIKRKLSFPSKLMIGDYSAGVLFQASRYYSHFDRDILAFATELLPGFLIPSSIKLSDSDVLRILAMSEPLTESQVSRVVAEIYGTHPVSMDMIEFISHFLWNFGNSLVGVLSEPQPPGGCYFCG